MVTESHAMGEGLSALAQFFVSDGTPGDTLLRVSQLACEVAPADMAGITLLVEGKPKTGVFTDAEAPDIDAAQYESGQGPCLDAFRHQRVYRIDSTSADNRWPDFARMAADHGIASTLSMPVTARGKALAHSTSTPGPPPPSTTMPRPGSRSLPAKRPSSCPTPRCTGTPGN